MGKRLLYEEVQVDKETGEVVTTSKHFSVKTTPEKFYMTYIDNLAAFFELRSLVDTKLLQVLCMRAEYDSGVVMLPAGERADICKLLSISSQQVTNSLNSLKKLRLITGEKGVYKINPSVFWKGSLDARRKVMEGSLQITVQFNTTDNNNFDKN